MGVFARVAKLGVVAVMLATARAPAYSQTVPRAQEYLIDTWQTEDGLPHSSVTSLAQTPDGYLWIGTYNGLARFDGVRFTLFDPANTPALTNPRVAWLGVDASGSLWVSTEDGSLAVRQQSGFHPVRVGSRAGIQGKALTFARSNEVVLLASDGKLWRQVGSNEGTNQLESLTPPGGGIVTSVGRDADGRVWCLYGRGKIARWTAAGFEGPLADLELKGKRIHSLEADAAERVWVGTDQELAVFEAGRFEDVTPTNGGPAQAFTGMTLSGDGGAWVMADGRLRKCVARRWVADAGLWTNKFEPVSIPVGEHVDQEGGIWFTHYGSGLLHVGPDGRERWLKMQDGLPGERLSCWLQDREGNVWAGLNRAGLVRLGKQRFRVLGLAEGLRERTVMSVCEDRDGAIWVGTFGGGLHRWANGTMEAFDVGVRDRNVVASVFPDRVGRVWVGTGGDGVLLWDRGELKTPWTGARAPQTGHAIFEDSKGRVWIGNASGLYLWAEGKWRRFGVQDGFDAPSARAVTEDAAGAVWIGTGDGGVYRFEGEKFTALRAGDALARQPVWSLLPDVDGTLWVGTFRGGLLRFKDGVFTRCTTKDGLPSDVICHILDGGNGQLWMSSHAGIVRVDKAALHAFADGQAKSVPCTAYGKHDGLPTVECSGNYQPAGWRGRDGRLWFATVKGVVSVQPSEITPNALPPPVVIEDALVDGESKIRTLKSDPLEIGPGRHYVEFRYTGLSFSAPDKVRFKHRLEGLEREWVEDGTRRTVNYSYIPPGNYRFQVLACNNDGVWNEAGAALALSVVPFVWQTWWFKALVAIGGFGAIGGAIRYVERRKLQRKVAQLEQQRAVEYERARIAQDMHDDLGSRLTQITLMSELAQDELERPAETGEYLRRIESSARSLTRAMDEIVWAVNPRNDSLEGLLRYLQRFAQEHLTLAGVRCRWEVPVQVPALALPANVRHNLYLACKEALHNVTKHATASEVRVRLEHGEGTFTLIIEDNGRGFAASGGVPGNGLVNMEKRLSDLGGRFEVESGAGSGTRVRFVVPVRPGLECRR